MGEPTKWFVHPYPCAKGWAEWDNGISVKFVIMWGELVSIELSAPTTKDMDWLNETELVKNLRKGIPPHG